MVIQLWGVAITVSKSNPNVVYMTKQGYYDANFPHNPIIKSTNGGLNWGTVTPPVGTYDKPSDLAIDPTDENVLYAPMSQGLYKSINGGANWTRVLDLTGIGNVYCAAIDPGDTSIIYATTAQGVYKSEDVGTTWVPKSTWIASASISDIEVNKADPSRIYAVVQHEGLLKSEDAGQNWAGVGFEGIPINSAAKAILFALVSLTPIFAAGIVVFFIRGITNPVKELLMATRKIKGGNLDYRIRDLEDEFGEVTESFNEMANRVEDYTQRLEKQTSELEHTHNEVSTFCQVLKQIGVQRKLDGVGSYLMKEFQGILGTPYMQLYILNSDRNTLFVLSDQGAEVIEAQELVQSAATIIDELDRITIAPKVPFKPPLLPDFFPKNGRLTIIPFRIEYYADGDFLDS